MYLICFGKWVDNMSTQVQVDPTEVGVVTKDHKKMFAVYIWMISYMRPYKWTLISLVLVIAGVSGAEMAIPKFFQYFIDVLYPQDQRRVFYWMMLGIPFFLAMILGGKALQNLLQRQLQEKSSRDLQYSIFKKLRQLGFAYFERNPIGETLSFMNTEVAEMQQMYRRLFPWFLNGLMMTMIAVILMVQTSPQLSPLFIPGFLIYYILGPWIQKSANAASKIQAERRVEENKKVYESISALSELRAFGAEKWDADRFANKVEKHNRSEIRTVLFLHLWGSNRRLSNYIGAIFIFIYGYYLVQQNSLTPGGFVSFLLYYFTATQSMMSLIANTTQQRILVHQAERIYDFMQSIPEVNESVNAIHLPQMQGELIFENVHFSYAPGMSVIRGLDLTVERGTRVALVGSTGSGKSTVLKLAGRFYDPLKGDIRLDGHSLRELSFDTVRSSLGYVFQETYLFGASVKENIRFGKPEANDQEIISAAKAACAHEFIMELPEGYDTDIGERGIKLSGGQKQRIGIARMFVKQPALILLDEATSALDNESELVVKEALARLLQGKTTLTVAHRISTVMDYDKIVMMDEGQAIEMGTYQELMSKKGAFHRLVMGGGEAAEYE